LEQVYRRGSTSLGAVSLLEGMVVVAETGLIWRVSRRASPDRPVTMAQAFVVSLIGNLVSIAVSLAAMFAMTVFAHVFHG
jgi:hypothetical protein